MDRLVRALLVACCLSVWIPEHRVRAQDALAGESLAGGSLAGQPLDTESVYFRVRFDEAAMHRVWIEASYPTQGAKELRLMMP